MVRKTGCKHARAWVPFAVMTLGLCASTILSAQQASPRGRTACQGEGASQREGGSEGTERPRRRPSRGVARAEMMGGMVEVSFGLAKSDGKDYAEIADLGEGEQVRFFGFSALKLKTDVDLRFGDLEVVKENVAKNYPGVYGLWIEKSGDGWQLVFTDKPDVWGTQYDAASKVGAVPLEHRAAIPPAELFGVEILTGSGASELRLSWGEHVWSTEFQAAGE